MRFISLFLGLCVAVQAGTVPSINQYRCGADHSQVMAAALIGVQRKDTAAEAPVQQFLPPPVRKILRE